MLDISLLGEQRVVAGEEPLRGLSPRTLGLLGFLVARAGSPQLRAHVAGVLWPDSTEEQARTNLRRELHQLRRALPEPDRCLAVDASTLCWRPGADARVDVVEFGQALAEAEHAERAGDDAGFSAAAERAVAVYGGPFMPGYYDDWVLDERDRLHRHCTSLLDRLVDCAMVHGSGSRAIVHAQRRVELEPLEETGYRALMALQVEAGDRGAALRTFHRCASMLEHELALTPSEDTLALHRSLRGAARPEPAPPADRATSSLVGRGAELAQLLAGWEGAVGRGQLHLVSGVGGVGKTRLVEELAREVERTGGLVARARCHPSTERLAMAPVQEWLRSPVLRDAVEQLDERRRAEIVRLRPELRTGQPPAVEPSGPWQRQRMFDAVTAAVLAWGPVMLVLDDLHWSDPETLDLVAHLLRVGQQAPLLIVATARTEVLAARPSLGTWLQDCAAEDLITETRLAPLDPHHTARLVAAVGDVELSPVELDRLHARTGGLPLLVIESLRGGLGTSRVEAVLAQRLAPLNPPAREACELIAVAGRAVSLGLLVAASDRDADAVVAAVEELWDAELLREGPGPSFELVHDLLRDAVHDAMSPPRRQRLHRAIAEALEELHVGDLRPVAADLAEHHHRAGQPDRAVEHHWSAASSAAEVLAHEAAVRHHRQAIAALDEVGELAGRRRVDALVRLGVAQRSAGHPDHLRTLLDAAAMARRHGAGDLLARAVLALSEDGYWSSSFADDPERAGLVRAALDLVPQDAAAERAALCARLAVEQYLAGDHAEVVALLDESERLARQLGEPRAILDALAARAFACQDPASIRGMPEVGRACVGLAARLGDRVRLIHELLRWDTQLRRVGRTLEADAALQRAEELAELVDHPPTRYWIANGRLAAALTEGDAGRADELVQGTADIGEALGFPDARRRALYATFATHLLRGRLADLAPMADALTDPGHNRPALAAARCLVLAHADDDRRSEAIRALGDLTARLDDLPPLSNPHLTLALLARAAHRLGEPAEATHLLERLRQHGGLVLFAAAASLGTTDHVLGLAAVAAGRGEEALGHLGRAADLERRAGMRGWLAQTEAELQRLAG